MIDADVNIDDNNDDEDGVLMITVMTDITRDRDYHADDKTDYVGDDHLTCHHDKY